MPLRNCPQSRSWCPHYHPDMCAKVETGKHDVCIHVRSVLGSYAAASVGALSALILAREWRIQPEVSQNEMSMVDELMHNMQNSETRVGG